MTGPITGPTIIDIHHVTQQTASMDTSLRILVDADACPVKAEIIKVAQRREIETVFVANSWLRLERDPLISMVVVPGNFDAADDWIAEHAGPRTIVITADILLAERCIKAGATVLKHDGREFDAASIGGAVATRAIMADLRAGMDGVGGGPAPFSKADRSHFLQSLDRVLVKISRA